MGQRERDPCPVSTVSTLSTWPLQEIPAWQLAYRQVPSASGSCGRPTAGPTSGVTRAELAMIRWAAGCPLGPVGEGIRRESWLSFHDSRDRTPVKRDLLGGIEQSQSSW